MPDAFLTSFVLPLVAGGDLHVGAPIAPKVLHGWLLRLDPETPVARALSEARGHVASEFVVREPVFSITPEELGALVGLHNALFTVHPRSLVSARTVVQRRVYAGALGLLRMAPPTTEGDLLARHTLFHQLLAITRTDLRLSWWAGSREFQGQAAPSRLLRWSSVRRVRAESEEVSFGALVLGERDSLDQPLVAVLRASPLTDLLEASRQHPPFAWGPMQASVLLSCELARVVAYRFTDENDDRAVPALLRGSRALWDMARPKADPADVRRVVAFLLHAVGLSLLAAQGRAPAWAALAERGDSEKEPPGSGAGLLMALPGAAARVSPAWGDPPGWDADEARTRWTTWRNEGERMFPGYVTALAARLAPFYARTIPFEAPLDPGVVPR